MSVLVGPMWICDIVVHVGLDGKWWVFVVIEELLKWIYHKSD